MSDILFSKEGSICSIECPRLLNGKCEHHEDITDIISGELMEGNIPADEVPKHVAVIKLYRR